MHRLIRASTLIALILHSFAVGAQTDSPAEIAIEFADPSLTSSSIERTQITVGTTGDSGTISGNITIATAADWLIGLKLKSPLEKEQKEVELANLDGLAGSTSGTLAISRAIWKQTTPGVLTKLCREYNSTLKLPERINLASECTFDNRGSLARKGEDWPARLTGIERAAEHEVCLEYNATGTGEPLLVDPNWPKTDEVLPNGYRGRCSVEELRRVSSSWVDKWEAAVKKRLLEACKEHNLDEPDAQSGSWIDLGGQCGLGELVKRGEPWASRARALVHPPWFISANATIADQNFTFADPDSFEEIKVSETGRSYGLSVGTLWGGNYIGLAAIRERSHKAAKATQLCVPFDGTEALTCRSTALQGPTEQTKELLQAEVRRYLGPQFGTISRITYNTDDSTVGYQLLLYGVQTKVSGFNYGIDLGYRDDTNDFTARAFVGVAFSLIGAGPSF